MNIRKQLFHILSFLPMLASPASFECSVDELGQVSPGSVCCRMSKDYGLTSCKSGPEPREVLLTFHVPQIKTHIQTLDDLIERVPFDGSYGILYPDKNDKDNENRVSIRCCILPFMLHYNLILSADGLRHFYMYLSLAQCYLSSHTTPFFQANNVSLSKI